MQIPYGPEISIVGNATVLLALLGLYGRFRIVESRVSDMWRWFMASKQASEKAQRADSATAGR